MTTIFGSPAVPYAAQTGSLVPQSFTATGGQTLYVLTNFTYSVGTNSLSVFKQGKLLISGRDYIETSINSFTLVIPSTAGDLIDVFGLVNFTNIGALPGQINFGANYTLANYIQDVQLSPRLPPYSAQGNGVTDDTAAINKAITALSLRGGGVLVLGPYTYYIAGTVLLPNNVRIEGTGATFTGTSLNHIIHTAALIGGILVDIVPEYGTGDQGAGIHYSSGQVNGLTFANCLIGIRGHRMNYGGAIRNCVFQSTCVNSWFTTHSFGLVVELNLVQSPAIMSDFVDFTRVVNNSFEGVISSNGKTALTITTGGYGGSYSSMFLSNGFHHWDKTIYFTCQGSNSVIMDNHAEDCRNHINGDGNSRNKFFIKYNWLKANCTPVYPTVTCITFAALTDSDIGPNQYSTDGASAYSSQLSLNTSNTVGNRIEVDYIQTANADPLAAISLMQIADSNIVSIRSGSNNSALVQPCLVQISGSSGYTIEQPVKKVNRQPNLIAYAVVAYVGTTCTIDLPQIPASATGTIQLVAFNLLFAGTSTYHISGMVSRLNVTYFNNTDEFSGAASGLTVVPSNNAGKLRLTIAGLSSGGNVVGDVRAICG